VNPIVKNGQDPWLIYHEGYYYYCGSSGNASSMWIFVSKARRLQGIGAVPAVRVWTPPSGTAYSKEIWAPELHYLDGKWYIYFAADDGNNANHRMYVLEGNTQDPQSSYTFKGQLKPTTDYWAIDGTVLTLGGQKFFLWSGHSTAYPSSAPNVQNLYIAQMSSPLTIVGDRYLLSEPRHDWESERDRSRSWSINEGPEVLTKGDRIHIIYSANGAWTEDYCLGQLTYSSGDVLKQGSWTKKATPVFSKTASIFGPGHASFVKSPDGAEDWIVYHSKISREPGWPRQVSAQKFTWEANGDPVFGSPVALGIPIQEPSDTTQIVTTTGASTRSGTSSVTSTTVLSTLTTQQSTSSLSEGVFMIVAVVLVVSSAVSLTVYRRRHKRNEKR